MSGIKELIAKYNEQDEALSYALDILEWYANRSHYPEAALEDAGAKARSILARVRYKVSIMNQVFVYETLKHKGIRDQALGGDRVKITPAVLKDFTEHFVTEGTERWPTLVAAPGHEVHGDLMVVSDEDLHKLDNWESRYQRLQFIIEDRGMAWVYIYTGAK